MREALQHLTELCEEHGLWPRTVAAAREALAQPEQPPPAGLEPHHIAAMERAAAILDARSAVLMKAGDYSCELESGDAESLREVLAWIRAQPERRGEVVGYIAHNQYRGGIEWANEKFLDLPDRTPLYTAPQPEQRGEVAYWAAADTDGTIRMFMRADAANGGMAARQEVNDWINDAIGENGLFRGTAIHLVALYTAPPAPAAPSNVVDAIIGVLAPEGIPAFEWGHEATPTPYEIRRFATKIAAAIAAPEVPRG